MLEHRPVLNDDWIEEQREEVQQIGSEEFYGRKLRDYAGWLEDEDFNLFEEAYMEKGLCYEYSEQFHVYREYDTVLKHTDRLLKEQLEERELYNKKPTEEQIDDVRDAVVDAGVQIAYCYAEAWYEYLKELDLLEPDKEWEVRLKYETYAEVDITAKNPDEALDEAIKELEIDASEVSHSEVWEKE